MGGRVGGTCTADVWVAFPPAPCAPSTPRPCAGACCLLIAALCVLQLTILNADNAVLLTFTDHTTIQGACSRPVLNRCRQPQTRQPAAAQCWALAVWYRSSLHWKDFLCLFPPPALPCCCCCRCDGQRHSQPGRPLRRHLAAPGPPRLQRRAVPLQLHQQVGWAAAASFSSHSLHWGRQCPRRHLDAHTPPPPPTTEPPPAPHTPPLQTAQLPPPPAGSTWAA